MGDYMMEECPECGGSGVDVTETYECALCGGIGYVSPAIKTEQALQAAKERVVETAKIWDDMATKDADSFYEAENALMKAVKALIVLESQGPAPGITTGQTPAAPEEGEDGPSQPVPQEEAKARVDKAKDGWTGRDCGYCRGTGVDPNSLNDSGPCMHCGGTGEGFEEPVHVTQNGEPDESVRVYHEVQDKLYSATSEAQIMERWKTNLLALEEACSSEQIAMLQRSRDALVADIRGKGNG